MANMSLGAVTFTQNPIRSSIIRPEKYCADVVTYDGVGFFSWGATIVGRKITLEWDYMPSSQFDSLDALYQANAPVVFDPQDGTSNSYNTEIVELEGEYHMYLESSSSIFRKNVRLTLLILSEV